MAALSGLLGVGGSLAHPELDRQIADLDGRIESEAPSAELFIRRAELNRIHRDWKAALEDLARARETEPKHPLIDYFVARVYLESGKLKAAGKHIDRFLRSQARHAGAWTIRARISMGQGSTAVAVKQYHRAIEFSHDARPGPGLYLERARAQASLGSDSIASAIEGLDAGSAALGRPVTLAQYAIELELERGNFRGAVDRIDRLASSAARQEGWHLKRGEIYENEGRSHDARREYDAALAALNLLPDSRRASRAMQRLEIAARDGLERLRSSDGAETN